MIRCAFVALCALALGCTPKPHWSLPLPALDRVALSVVRDQDKATWVVGGSLGSGGDALAMAYDGSKWNRYSAGTDATLWWITEIGAYQLLLVGERGTALLGNAGGFTSASQTTTTLYGAWGQASDDFWVVGGEPDLSGIIAHVQPAAGWVDLTPPGTSGAFFKVWGAAGDDVWICGQNGALLHWNGSALTAVDAGLPRNVSLFTIAGRNAQDIYAVGGPAQAVALHYDGTSWSQLTDPIFATLPGLNGVAVDSDGTAVMVGFGGTKLRGHPGAFVDESAFATHEDLHAVSILDGEIFAVGGDYLDPAPAPRTGVVAHFGGDISSTIK